MYFGKINSWRLIAALRAISAASRCEREFDAWVKKPVVPRGPER